MNGQPLTLSGAARAPAPPTGPWQAPLFRWLHESQNPWCCPGRGRKSCKEEEDRLVPSLSLTEVRGGSSGLGMNLSAFGLEQKVKGTWGAGVLMAERNLKMKELCSHINQIYQRYDFLPPPAPSSTLPPVDSRRGNLLPVPCSVASGLHPR